MIITPSPLISTSSAKRWTTSCSASLNKKFKHFLTLLINQEAVWLSTMSSYVKLEVIWMISAVTLYIKLSIVWIKMEMATLITMTFKAFIMESSTLTSLQVRRLNDKCFKNSSLLLSNTTTIEAITHPTTSLQKKSLMNTITILVAVSITTSILKRWSLVLGILISKKNW